MKYNAKQIIALALLKAAFTFYLFFGGSRSGKTFAFLRCIITRASNYKNTKHLIVRAKKTTCVNTIWQDMLRLLNETVERDTWEENKSDHVIKFFNGSEIWSGGLDDQTQVDKILGTEWATIYINEASEIAYRYFEILRTRLNVNPNKTKIKRKFYIDENPPTPEHWTNKLFIERIDPNTGKKLSDDEAARYAYQHFHPKDNAENLDPQYLKDLENLSGMARKRFWDGVFAFNFVGQVYHKFNRDTNIDNTIREEFGVESWRTWDFGIRDASFIMWIQLLKVPTTGTNKLGLQINIIDEYENTEQSADHYAGVCNTKYKASTWYDAGDPAGAQRNARLESWIGILAAHNINVRYKTGYSIADLISHANQYIPYVRVNAEKCPRTVAMFENWSYIIDKAGKVPEGALPVHDAYSHAGTAFYYFCINAFEPKRAGGKMYVI